MSGALAFLGSVGHVLDYAQQQQERQKQLEIEKMKLQQAQAEFQFTQQQLQMKSWSDKVTLGQNLYKLATENQPAQSSPYSVSQSPGQGGPQPPPQQGGPTLPGAQMIGTGANGGLPGGSPQGMPMGRGMGALAGPLPTQAGGQMGGMAPQQPSDDDAPPPVPNQAMLEQQIAALPAAQGKPPGWVRAVAAQAMPELRKQWQEQMKIYQAKQIQARTAATEKRQASKDSFTESVELSRLGLDRARLGVEDQRLAMEAQRFKDAESKTVQASPDAIYDSAREFRETGKMPALGLNSGSTRAQILNEAARQRRLEKVTVEADIAHSAGVTADSRSLNNLQKQADAAESFEATAKKNFELALSLAPKGVPTNLGPFVNRWVQDGSTASGNKDVPPYVAALLTGADEYAKIMSGSTGSQGSTVDARRAAAEMFSHAYDVDQIKNVIEGVAYRDMNNRTQSYDDRLNFIKQRIASNPSGSAQSNAPPKISSDAEYNALPSGTEFIAPDGSHRKKP